MRWRVEHGRMHEIRMTDDDVYQSNQTDGESLGAHLIALMT